VNAEGCTIIEMRFLGEGIDYTGLELRSHFIRQRTRIASDGLIAFVGRCEVDGARLVDLEDAAAGSVIRARKMLHFIGEHFQCPLREGNARLRLFAAVVKEAIEEMAPGTPAARRGDDLFVNGRKLTVAICTVSPVSTLFHFGVNVDPLGAPVPAVGLAELGIETAPFALSVLERYRLECESIELALRKVRGVP
jgi:hypothetical protein